MGFYATFSAASIELPRSSLRSWRLLEFRRSDSIDVIAGGALFRARIRTCTGGCGAYFCGQFCGQFVQGLHPIHCSAVLSSASISAHPQPFLHRVLLQKQRLKIAEFEALHVDPLYEPLHFQGTHSFEGYFTDWSFLPYHLRYIVQGLHTSDAGLPINSLDVAPSDVSQHLESDSFGASRDGEGSGVFTGDRGLSGGVLEHGGGVVGDAASESDWDGGGGGLDWQGGGANLSDEEQGGGGATRAMGFRVRAMGGPQGVATMISFMIWKRRTGAWEGPVRVRTMVPTNRLMAASVSHAINHKPSVLRVSHHNPNPDVVSPVPTTTHPDLKP